MSILLEALRKTEKNQQQQQVPNIHSDEQGSPELAALKTGPLVAMIAVALFVSGWFTWRQYQLPEGLYLPPVTLAPGQVRSSDVQAREENSQVKQAPVRVENKPATAPSTPIANNAANQQQRTPVETYQAPSASTSGPNQAQTAAPSNSSPFGATTGSSSASTSGSSSSRPTNQQSGGGFDQSRPASTNQTGNTARPVQQDTAHIPEPIGYWELPDAIRADVPEIKYSVLVYNNDPAQRFVLVNGQRLAEGDSAQPGLVVDEIRRDGVIFSYRLYKFLVER